MDLSTQRSTPIAIFTTRGRLPARWSNGRTKGSKKATQLKATLEVKSTGLPATRFGALPGLLRAT
jgi:hypothetical protein